MAATIAIGLRADAADPPLPLPAAVIAAAKSEIVPKLEEMGVKSVGVLKFVALGADGKPTTRLGAINSDLASQFQLAILMNLSKKRPIAVLRDPNGVAASLPNANHLSAAGRQHLFAATYPVVVGGENERVKADAFLFGVVQVAGDYETATVDVRVVRGGDDSPQPISVFTAGLSSRELPAVGASFISTRGQFAGGQAGRAGGKPAEQPTIDASAIAADIRSGRKPFPLADPEAPVTLSVEYDGVTQRIEYRDGGAYLAEPHQGQQVSITLRKTREDGRRYAVALKVNGENTAERDVKPDFKASKWILSDDFMKFAVRGYAVGTEAVQPFVVLSSEESAKRAFDYGVDAGTITMTVYAEQDAKQPTPDTVVQSTASKLLDQMLLAGGIRLDPAKTFESLDQAKTILGSTHASPSRGIIAADAKAEAFKKEIVDFKLVPDPLMSVVIRYYHP